MLLNKNQSYFARPIPDLFLPELRRWSREGRSSYFLTEESDLYHLVALLYADPAMPSVSRVYRTLCALVDEDAAHNLAPVRKPSLTTFRRIVKSLPKDFVSHMRFGLLRKLHTFDIVARGAEVLAIDLR